MTFKIFADVSWLLLASACLAGCGSVTESSAVDSGSTVGDSGTYDSAKPPAASCPSLASSGTSALYDHQIQRATSATGDAFTPTGKVLLPHASVPDAVIGPDGKHWVYFVNGNPGQHAVFIARLEGDALVTFDCLRLDDKVNGNAVDPDIVRLADGRYRLFYFQGSFIPGTPPLPPGTPHSFYSAISTDGIHFTVEGKVLETSGGGTDPSAVQLDDGTWLMSLSLDDRAALARSTDAKTFTLTGVEFEAAITELARFDGGKTVRAYLATKDGMKVKVSTDRGKSWTDGPTLTGLGADPSMVQNPDGSWAMYYKSFASTP